MESDEGELVIDEEELLVASRSPARSPSLERMDTVDTSQDESNDTNVTSSESNVDNPNREQVKINRNNKKMSPKPSKSSSSSHKSSSSQMSPNRDEDNTSSNDRHRRQMNRSRNRSKDKVRNIPTTPDTPRREPKGSHQNGFRLSHLSSLTSKELNMSALKHQFYNMRLYVHRNRVLVCEPPFSYPAPQAVSDINLKQLFNWPHVCFTIHLEHVTIVHELRTNIERSIIIGDDDYVNMERDTENVQATQYLQAISSSRDQKSVPKDMLRCYLDAILKAAPLYSLPKTKFLEIEAAFGKIQEYITTIPGDFIETVPTHSRFLNKYKYVRIIDNNTSETNHSKRAKIREIINPESILRFERCTIPTDHIDVWLPAIETYFEEILITRRGQNVKNLMERFKKCLTMRCEVCNLVFEGAMSTVSMKEHIKDKHFFDKPWECNFCKKSWTQFELAEMNWKHECKIIDDEDESTISSSQG